MRICLCSECGECTRDAYDRGYAAAIAEVVQVLRNCASIAESNDRSPHRATIYSDAAKHVEGCKP